MELVSALAVVPEKMTDVGFGSPIISFMHRKIVFQLGRHYSQIVNEVGMLPGALKIQDIDFFVVEDVIHGIWITVNHAAMGLIDERIIPPVTERRLYLNRVSGFNRSWSRTL